MSAYKVKLSDGIDHYDIDSGHLSWQDLKDPKLDDKKSILDYFIIQKLDYVPQSNDVSFMYCDPYLIYGPQLENLLESTKNLKTFREHLNSIMVHGDMFQRALLYEDYMYAVMLLPAEDYKICTMQWNSTWYSEDLSPTYLLSLEFGYVIGDGYMTQIHDLYTERQSVHEQESRCLPRGFYIYNMRDHDHTCQTPVYSYGFPNIYDYGGEVCTSLFGQAYFQVYLYNNFGIRTEDELEFYDIKNTKANRYPYMKTGKTFFSDVYMAYF